MNARQLGIARCLLVFGTLVGSVILLGTSCTHYQSSTAAAVGDHEVRTFNQENFDTLVLGSEQPVLVHFWATHTGANLATRKSLVSLSRKFDEQQLLIGQFDTSKHSTLALKYEINSTPSIAIFHRGMVVKILEGRRSEMEIQNAIEEVL